MPRGTHVNHTQPYHYPLVLSLLSPKSLHRISPVAWTTAPSQAMVATRRRITAWPSGLAPPLQVQGSTTDAAANPSRPAGRPRELRCGACRCCGDPSHPATATARVATRRRASQWQCWNRLPVLLQPARRMRRPRRAASGGARCWDRLRGMLQPWLGDAGTETRRVAIGRPATVILLDRAPFFATTVWLSLL